MSGGSRASESSWKKEKTEANLWREAEKPGGKIEVVPKDNLVSVFHSSVYLSNYSTHLPRTTMDRPVGGKEKTNEHKGTCKLSALRKDNSG